ncbi:MULTISPECIES: peptide chain release factor N(5)-glutamine methyltransferase [Cysteiniphilum]|uniref:Release factor glutamine methyltransferase n=1 Tax=Cysteiniphilum litorale TaxID=2056700 RepID=A0A8J2Z6V1_9GAMM|nr:MULTISPECIES: peptide chain release factor N(5)-glutamine methyltransferase [Cysteiniphilum]GGG08561.1 release factor glutamine methyltransferase [Cysteiniphilum litorale]
MPNNTIQAILSTYSKQLEPISDSARIDIECLLCHVLKVAASYLYTWSEKPLTEDEFQQFSELFMRRLQGEPVAYLTGKQGFWDLEFLVDKHTLIPRADTEVLIETILNKFTQHTKLQVLDLGTGSGAIALSLAHARPNWQVTAIDYCEHALKIAAHNKEHYKLSNVKLLQGSWYQPVANEQFDIIVSNPPYIDQSDPALCAHVRQYEPTTALIAKNNGLADIEHIICHGKAHLKENGFMIIEHGFQQAQHVESIFKSYDYKNIQHYHDLSGHIRATSAES